MAHVFVRSQRAERIGLLGGTFDPPHIGHLVAAVNIRAALGLDSVLLVVANDPWQKSGLRVLSSPVDRLQMVEAAVADVEGVHASDLEIRRGGPSYTVDTVAELRAQDDSRALFVVIGRDAAAGLPTWHRADDLAQSVIFAVVDRPGTSAQLARPTGFEIVEVDIPHLEVSSTLIRARVAAGRPIDFLTPPSVRSFIRDRGLYSVPR